MTPVYRVRGIHTQLNQAVLAWRDQEFTHGKWINLDSAAGRGNTSLLRNLAIDLHAQGFGTLYVDCEEQPRPGVPGPLAEATLGVLNKRLFRRVVIIWREIASGGLTSLARLLLICVIVIAALLIQEFYKFSKDPAISSANRDLSGFFAVYLPKHMSALSIQLLVDSLWKPTLAALIGTLFLKARGQSADVDGDTQRVFRTPAGYVQELCDIADGLPLVLLLDNAGKLSGIEVKVLSSLFREANGEEDARSPRVLVVGLGKPRNVVLRPTQVVTVVVPELDKSIRNSIDPISQVAYEEVEQALTEVAFEKSTGIGMDVWSGYEALLNRTEMTMRELKDRYGALAKSEVASLLGYSEIPSNLPHSTLRRHKRSSEIYTFDEARRRATLDYLQKFHPDALNKSRLLLLDPWIRRLKASAAPQKWDEATCRDLMLAAETAMDLDDDLGPKSLMELLAGEEQVKFAVLHSLVSITTEAAAVLSAQADFIKAHDYLRSAGSFYGAVSPHIPDALADRFFYQAWTTFWLSGDPTQRDWLMTFEESQPQVRESTAWNILTGFEHHLQGAYIKYALDEAKPLAPSLANIWHLTEQLRYDRYGSTAANTLTDGKKLEYLEEPEVSFPGLRLALHFFPAEIQSDIGLNALLRLRSQITRMRQEAGPGDVCAQLILDFYDVLTTLAETSRAVASAEPDVQPVMLTATDVLSRLIEVRDAAAILRIRQLLVATSYYLGWLTLVVNRSPDNTAGDPESESTDWKLLVDADRYFQVVINIEQELDWVDYTPVIYEERWRELRSIDQMSALDDAIGLYLSAKKAGYPVGRRMEYLHRASVAATNHGTSREHRQHSAMLHEHIIAAIGSGEYGREYWHFEYAEEEQAHELVFVAQDHRITGEYGKANEALEEAKELLRSAGMEHPQSESLASLESDVLGQRIALALALGQDAADLLQSAWSTLRFHYSDAGFIFTLLLQYERKTKLELLWPVSGSGEWLPDPDNPELSPDAASLPPTTVLLNRLTYRWLQLMSGENVLRKANPGSLNRLVLLFAEYATSIPLHADYTSFLVSSLRKAEQFFSVGDASNEKQREALKLLATFAQGDDDLKGRLASLDEEDRLLQLRETAVQNRLEHSNWLEELAMLDIGLSGTLGSASYDPVLDDRISSINALQSAFEDGAPAHSTLLEAEALLSRSKSSAIVSADLRVCSLWLEAASFDRSVSSAAIDEKLREMERLASAYLGQHLPRTSAERIRLLSGILCRRFDELRALHARQRLADTVRAG